MKEMINDDDIIDPRGNGCSYAVKEAYFLFRRLHRQREYVFSYGMKKPSYHCFTSRQILDEIELQEPITDKDYLVDLLEVMDEVMLEDMNRPS